MLIYYTNSYRQTAGLNSFHRAFFLQDYAGSNKLDDLVLSNYCTALHLVILS